MTTLGKNPQNGIKKRTTNAFHLGLIVDQAEQSALLSNQLLENLLYMHATYAAGSADSARRLCE